MFNVIKMKKLKKLSILLILFSIIGLSSCEDSLNMNLTDDPNSTTLDKADLGRYMNQVQVNFSGFVSNLGSKGSQLTRINYMFGKQYAENYDPVSGNGPWDYAYRTILTDIDEAAKMAEEKGYYNHLGVLKVLKAYIYMSLVDYFGDVPYSEVNQPEDFPFPHVDDDADVYEACIGLLNDAISDFNAGAPYTLENDFYYGNDFTKWEKLANTLKMKIYLNTRLVDSNAKSKFDAIVADGNYINSDADNFFFQYGTSSTQPNTRHGNYNADYTTSGASTYRSNWLMNEMHSTDDPRIRYYFYRQVSCTPGCGCDANQVDLPCSVQSRPPHYPSDMVFCCIDDGYWGRDHGNDEGIPPDGFKRTVVGVYPAGGKFDDDEFASVTMDDGGMGAGILPIMMNSWVQFMKAEMKLANGQDASSDLEAAVNASIAHVMTFGTLDPDADSAFFPSSSDVTNYVDGVMSDYNAASTNDKWEILAKQMFIAHYGNGIDAYDFYRRTGYPHSLQYNVDPNPGVFVRSFFYPADEANANSNIVQKSGVGEKVFWDNNPDSPAFPQAN